VSSEAPPPREKDERERSRLERIVPDLVRRLVDVGVEKLADGPESIKQLLSDLKLPKEAVSVLTSQVEETKREVTKALAREIREFLERASLADELTRLLSGLTLEIKTQVRFVPSNDGKLVPRPEMHTKVGVHERDAGAESRADTTPPPQTSPTAPQSNEAEPPPAQQEKST
jgi:histidinol dehydrogenase